MLVNNLSYVVTEKQQIQLEELDKKMATLGDMRESVDEIVKNTNALVHIFGERDKMSKDQIEKYIT
jgi:hypothetical protein